VITRGHLDALERKSHRPLKCASLSQRGHADFAAHVAGDRVRWFAVTHGHHLRAISHTSKTITIMNPIVSIFMAQLF
jgi:hypothetical protein